MTYKVVERPKLTVGEKLYLPAVLKGLGLTLKYFFKRKKFTREYPEEPTTVPEGYRGLPALVKDDEGRTKCVACSPKSRDSRCSMKSISLNSRSAMRLTHARKSMLRQ